MDVEVGGEAGVDGAGVEVALGVTVGRFTGDVLAGVGVGLYPDYRAAGNVIPIERTFEPDAERHARYREIHERVYRRLYPALRKVRAL